MKMPNVAFISTGLSHGGNVIEGSPNVTVNGKLVARVGDAAICSKHGLTSISSGSGTVSANGRKIARIGDPCACGASLVDPVSPNVSSG